MTRKKSGRKPNIAAAIAGAGEVAAELSGNKEAATKLGMSEKRAQGSPRRMERPRVPNARSPRGERSPSGGNAFKQIATTAVEYTRTEMPTGKVVSGSGREYVSYGWADPYRSQVAGLFGVGDATCLFSGLYAGSVLTPGETALNTLLLDIPNQLYTIAASYGLSITGLTSATFGTSFGTYMSTYMGLYNTLRGLQAIMGLYGFNNACNRVATNWLNSKSQIEARIARLEAYSMPKAILDCIDKVCGVYLSGNSNDPPFFTFVTTVQDIDLGLAASVTTILANIDAQFAVIAGLPAPDYGNIIRLFGYLYGTPGPFGPKPIHTETQLYYQQLARMMSYYDTGNTTLYSGPAANWTTNGTMIATLVWGDLGALDPQWITLFRPMFFTTVGNALVANVGVRGVFGTIAASTGSDIQYYDSQTGAYFADDMTGAAARSINGAIATDFSFPWAFQADQLDPIITTSVVMFTGYGVLYINTNDIYDDTGRLWQHLFFDNVVGPRKF